MAQRSNDGVYQLHIQLAYIEPPMWRRLVVSGQVTLFALHQMLQVVMGWENYHLHQFTVGKIHYGEPDPEYGDTMKDDRRVRLNRIAREQGASFIYEYDFGDGWRHVITVESIQPFNEDMFVPRCLDGARACPPEDCGGIGGILICSRRYEIAVILSVRNCVPGWESIMIQSCFHCSRSIRRWVCSSLWHDERFAISRIALRGNQSDKNIHTSLLSASSSFSSGS